MIHRVRSLLGVCAALAGVSCIVSTDDSAEVARRASPLTGIVLTGPGGYELSMETSDGLERAFYLYLPDGYVHGSGTLHPLVAMFHGFGGNAYDFAAMLAGTGLQDLADDEDKIFVFLEANPGSSVHLPGVWDTTALVRDDVLFTDEVLELLIDGLDVDEERVYAGGHSLGGRFVHELGSRIPGRFRAIADISGFYSSTGLFGAPAPPAVGTLLPVLIVHSGDDPLVPFAGGVGFLGYNYDAAQFTYDTWYTNNGCTRQTHVINGIAYSTTRTKCDPSRTEPMIELIAIPAVGHAWPEGAPYDASSEMLAFFNDQ
jgi:poly(3-hydroxybutyrate) depolymerase